MNLTPHLAEHDRLQQKIIATHATKISVKQHRLQAAAGPFSKIPLWALGAGRPSQPHENGGDSWSWNAGTPGNKKRKSGKQAKKAKKNKKKEGQDNGEQR
jgi:hypothetical protein